MPKLKEEWWHTMSDGGKCGWMLPWEFEEWLNATYTHGAAPRVQFAHAMGIDVSKVSRWATGKDPIPKWVGVVAAMTGKLPRGEYFSEPDAPWLPYSYCVNGKQYPPRQNAGEHRGRHPKQAA